MGVGIGDLIDALTKAGASPDGSALDMQRSIPGLKQNLQGAVFGGDTQIPQYRKDYHTQLAAIAQMDQKLAGTYGNPSSKLYIEHPLQREQLLNTPRSTGYQVASNITRKASARQGELNTTVDEALKFYNQLVAMQVKDEAIAKKQAKSGGVGGTGTGNRSTGLGGVGGIKLTKEQKLAGFKDARAANYWSKIKEPDFKRLWVQNMLEGDEGSIPDDGFSIDDVKINYDSWKKTRPAKSGASSSISQDKINQLKAAFSVK